MPTVEDNASLQPEKSPPATPEITDDIIVSHPRFKELEEKHSAARTGMDQANLTKKELQAEVARLRVLAGETETPKEEAKPEPQYVTREELESKAWDIANAKDLEIYADDQYKKELDLGVPKATALEYAKLRYQSKPNEARLERQKSFATGTSTSVRNLESPEINEKDRQDMKEYGYSEETLLRHKQMMKARGRI